MNAVAGCFVLFVVWCRVGAENITGFSYEMLASRLDSIQGLQRDQLTYINQTVVKLERLAPLLQKFQLQPSIPQPSRAARSSETLASSCRNVPSRVSGLFLIDPNYPFEEPMTVYCDQQYEGGGWTIIQRRMDGSVNFMRDWGNYKRGFGTLHGEFWLGLENIYRLTNVAPHELAIELEDFDGARATARYDLFRIGAESVKYAMTDLGSCVSCSAGDSLRIHLNESFSTYDKDNSKATFNCAESFKGAWWFYKCHRSHLNGEYLQGKLPDTMDSRGLMWNDFRGSKYSLKSTRMMIRPRAKK